MTDSEDNYEKVLFRYHSNVLDDITVETMWAKIVDKEKGIYQLDNIPFYGPAIATDDEFLAEFDSDEDKLTFREVTKHSGNSIVLVIVAGNELDRDVIRNKFKELNCTSEAMNEKYFSMEILKHVDYSEVRTVLEDFQAKELINFAEPCLSQKHAADMEVEETNEEE
jgi:hypothetical protein